jgi:hypothetical protein
MVHLFAPTMQKGREAVSPPTHERMGMEALFVIPEGNLRPALPNQQKNLGIPSIAFLYFAMGGIPIEQRSAWIAFTASP